MSEQRLLFLDINTETKTSVGAGVNKPLWSRSDNSFRFNFLADGPPAPQGTASPAADHAEASSARLSFTGQGSGFAFNFQIPPAAPPNDINMDTEEEKPALLQEGVRPPEQAKKKTKPGKKKASDAEVKEKAAEGGHGAEKQSAEEQLNRQLDWCIEQLELGLRSKKGTPKQKEEASRALKTLRSSKAPLVKKRQVMRATAGDYRTKMEEEKTKQFKLIRSEVASAQVKVVSDRPKTSVFHRKADVQTKPQDDGRSTEMQDETSAFVFVPSKEEFCFNFF
ncbi:UPF0488 protein C8orf33 homolog [Austrofundulus limnaeus]|uniref:UPF0488 protein C8orf33 homolog n=1 Tax=Austrofundulus limnaeus TaxID=52670 RepID=A0A2I4D475_AUSLI|nr:PREDICTED: UPF0488 protein C8orf33 homolog [Austrofundulus limnaeus]